MSSTVCSTVNSSSSSICSASTMSAAPTRRQTGCSHCISCCSGLSWKSAALIRSCNSSEEWKEWWPAGLTTPTVYFFLRAKQLRYLQQHPNRDVDTLWRPFTECDYSASGLLHRRRCAPLAIHVPATVTGLDSSEDSSIRFVGARLVLLHSSTHHPHPSPAAAMAAAAVAAARAAVSSPSPATLPAVPALAHHQQQQPCKAPPPLPSSQLIHQQATIPAPAAALQTPLAAALAAAKRLAALASASGAAASAAAAPHPSSSGVSTGGLHRVPRCLEVALLSPAGSSGSLSVASSSGSFAGSLRQLAVQSSSPPSLASPSDYPPHQHQHQHQTQAFAAPPPGTGMAPHYGRPPLPPSTCACACAAGSTAARLRQQLQRRDCCQQAAAAAAAAVGPLQWGGLSLGLSKCQQPSAQAQQHCHVTVS